MVGVWSVFVDRKKKCCLKTSFTGYGAGFFPQVSKKTEVPEAGVGKVWITVIRGTWKCPLVVSEVNSPHHYCRQERPAYPDSSKVQYRTQNRCSIKDTWVEFYYLFLRKFSRSQLSPYSWNSFKIGPHSFLCSTRNNFQIQERGEEEICKAAGAMYESK